MERLSKDLAKMVLSLESGSISNQTKGKFCTSQQPSLSRLNYLFKIVPRLLALVTLC